LVGYFKAVAFSFVYFFVSGSRYMEHFTTSLLWATSFINKQHSYWRQWISAASKCINVIWH